MRSDLPADSHDSQAYTYAGTNKVCRGSASSGRPKPHTALHRTGSPPLSGYARPAWFPDGYGSSALPIGRPFDQTPRVGRTGLETRPADSGGALANEGPAPERPLRRTAETSALYRRKPRAMLLLAFASLAAPARSPNPDAGVTARPPRSAGGSSRPRGPGSRTGRGREAGRNTPYGSNPCCHRHPHLLGL